jgi:flagellar hook-associated protein 3 FlgL
MRITHQLITKSVLSNIQRNQSAMGKLQEQLASGKKLRRPSDDPIRVARVMGHNTQLAQNQQYQKNISAATSWMKTTEDALGRTGDVVQRLRELAIQGANGAMSDNAREAIVMEMDELVNVLVQLGNTSYEGRYIFAGHQTNVQPFTRSGNDVLYNGDQGGLKWEVAPQVTIRGNITGSELYMDNDIFGIIHNLQEGLLQEDQSRIQGAIGDLSEVHDHVLDKRAGLGAVVYGLEMTMEKFNDENINFQQLRSQLEDIDFAETYMHYATMENIYRASVAMGARIIQPSLLDFLR